MISFDWKNADASAIGNEHGLEIKKEFSNYKKQIANIVSELYSSKDQHGKWLKWMNLGYQDELIQEINQYAQSVKGKFDNLLVLGIGGSALGGICITEALLKPYWNILDKNQRNDFPRIFFVDNIDPDQINGLFDVLDLKKTLVNVITKSGTTAETMSAFMIIQERLEKELGDSAKENIVTTTDRNKGILREITNEKGYKSFIVPDDVGGRFSVFSAVGLLPFALTGINISEMLKGVREMDDALKNTDVEKNIAAQNALIHYLMDKKGKNLSVMMPYSSRLRYVSDWYVQLWAESLGKETDLDGNVANIGPTPLKALGATDQHSQIQLYNEGPNDKLINFIRVGCFDTELRIPEVLMETGVGYLGGKSVNKLMNAEADATRIAVTDFKKPNVNILVPKVNEYYLGQLLYMLEVQTAIAGALYNIDTFNQPGVEQGKNYTYALMGRKGYEKTAKELEQKLVTSICQY
ncbi:MAG TPA: glucose-6-phosphate isomerase [Candidatus Gastranaerophilales bacterium]|nr:glucose-6-phosphate isomerase [Candidatus Gastranaerophilales bacterium]